MNLLIYTELPEHTALNIQHFQLRTFFTRQAKTRTKLSCFGGGGGIGLWRTYFLERLTIWNDETQL